VKDCKWAILPERQRKLHRRHKSRCYWSTPSNQHLVSSEPTPQPTRTIGHCKLLYAWSSTQNQGCLYTHAHKGWSDALIHVTSHGREKMPLGVERVKH